MSDFDVSAFDAQRLADWQKHAAQLHRRVRRLEREVDRLKGENSRYAMAWETIRDTIVRIDGLPSPDAGLVMRADMARISEQFTIGRLLARRRGIRKLPGDPWVPGDPPEDW